MIEVKVFGLAVREEDIFDHVVNELTYEQRDALLDECIWVSYRLILPDEIDDRMAYIFKLMLASCEAHFIESVILRLIDCVEGDEMDEFLGECIEVRRR